MRYRGGGRIGGFDQYVPQKAAARGCWKMGEATQWLHVDRWPRRIITITGMPEQVDTTVGGYGEIKPNIYSEYGYGLVDWQYSDNGGTTWTSAAPGPIHSVDANGYMYLSGQSRNTGSTAAYPITNPPPAERATVNGGLPNDGRLYRVVVTSGLRRVASDYYDNAEGKWKGRCEVWNDRVTVSFINGPCGLTGEVTSCAGAQATATVPVGDEIQIFAEAKAVGQEHLQEYDIAYSWRVRSSLTTGNWAVLPATGDSGANTNTLRFVNAVAGLVYLQCVATFTYSDPPDHVVPLTQRPLVSGYSDIIAITVTEQG
jgi:hypothetical protein